MESKTIELALSGVKKRGTAVYRIPGGGCVYLSGRPFGRDYPEQLTVTGAESEPVARAARLTAEERAERKAAALARLRAEKAEFRAWKQARAEGRAEEGGGVTPPSVPTETATAPKATVAPRAGRKRRK